MAPEASSQPGGRRRVRFRPQDIREAQLISELRRHPSGPQLRKALNYLRRLGYNPLSTRRFMMVELDSGRREFIKGVGSGQRGRRGETTLERGQCSTLAPSGARSTKEVYDE